MTTASICFLTLVSLVCVYCHGKIQYKQGWINGRTDLVKTLKEFDELSS